MSSRKIFGLLIIVLFVQFDLLAQTELQVEEVQVIKDFEARLKDFRKVKLEPVLPVYDISDRKYEYKVSSKPIKLEYEKPSIRPLALPNLPSMPLKNGGFEFAYGLPNAFHGSFNYGKINEDFSSSVAIRHSSANNKNIEHQKFMKNTILFNINDVLGNDVLFDGNANINVDYINLFGVVANLDSMQNFNSPQRRLMHWDLNTTFNKNEITDAIDAAFKIKYKFLHNNLEALVENDFLFSADFKYRINDQFSISLPLQSEVSLSQVSQTNTLYRIIPTIRYHQPYFNLEFGGEVVYHNEWVAFPEVLISLNKIFGYFDVFAGVGQESYLNTGHFKMMENPFFRMAGDSILMTHEQGYFGGVRGDIEGAKFEVSANYSKTKNAHLFVPSIVDTRQFDVVYDLLTDFYIEGSLSYEITRNITLTGALEKHFYTVENELKAWHRPDWNADFTSRFSFLKNKLLLDGSVFFMSGLHYPSTLNGQAENLPVIFDVSGKVQYELFRNFRMFVQWNNITATKYNRWYQYPAYRIHLLGGVKVLF